MKRALLFVLCMAQLLALPCSAVVRPTAPVAPTKSFYVNDYAGVIFSEHRDKIAALAKELERQTGVQAVMLTADSLGSQTIEQYAGDVMLGWEIGGPGQNGFVILYVKESDAAYIALGEGMSTYLGKQETQRILEDTILPFFEGYNYSTGLLNGYKELLRTVYANAGIPLTEELQQLEQTQSGGGGFMLFFLVFGLAIMVRAMWVSHKYRKKYLYRHNYVRRGFVKQARIFDDNPSGPDTAEPKLRRRGFIIYRDNQQDNYGNGNK